MLIKKEDLKILLVNLANSIEEGDSFEGNLSYTCMEDHIPPGSFELTGAFRTGNTQGQGGTTILDHSKKT